MQAESNEFRRGWRMLVAAFAGSAFGASAMAFHAIGPMTLPISEEFGWGRGDVQLALFFFNVAVVLFAPWVGAHADRVGVRRVAIAALAAFGLVYMSLSLVPGSLLVYYGVWFLLGALGGYSTPISWSRGVNAWFSARRGLALSIALTGTGITAIFLPSTAVWLIDQVGWRLTFVILAGFPLLLALPFVVAWFREPGDASPGKDVRRAVQPAGGATLREALRGYRYWAMLLAAILAAVGMSGTISNFVPLLVDDGFSRQQAANVAATIGFAIIVGRIVTGVLIDRYWAPAVAFPILLMPAASALLLASGSPSTEQAILAAVLVGLATGAEADLLSYLTVRYFGLLHYGSVFGLQYGAFALAVGLAPFMFAEVFDRFGGYTSILYVAAAMAAVGAVLVLSLGPYPDRHDRAAVEA